MSLQDFLIIVLIASVMLSMGLALRPQDFWLALRRPGPMLLILLINVLLLPALGWAMGQGLSAEMALALLLAGACGVGSTAPLFTANVGGDIALSTAAMVISGFICLLSLPLTLALIGFELTGSSAALGDIAQQAFYTLLLWQVIPLLLGMLIHARWRGWAERWAPRFKQLGNGVLGLLIVGITATQGHLIVGLPLQELGYLALLVLATYSLPLLFFSSKPWGSALLFCSCTRNLNLALLLASQVFDSDALLLAILSYAFVMYILLLPFTFWIRRTSSPQEAL